MATDAVSLLSAAPSQKQRRVFLRKERRKRKRQALAQAKEWGLQHEVDFITEEAGDGNEEDGHTPEVERQGLHEEWLERERLAQEEFKIKFEREEAARTRKEEEERRIKEEWEVQQKREQEEKEQKQLEKQHREEAVQKMLDEAEHQLESRGPWKNPEAPVTESMNYGTERDVANCSFFLKTGACRFGDRCSRKHVYPTSSQTLMIRSMFTTFGMEESYRDDYDIDACLEHSEEELQEYFLDFYHDVLAEFRSVGKVVQFKVSCNFEPHLRGNVYIQFATEEKCNEAFIKFNGRWYAGKQLQCELCPVTRWKNAICGLFDRQKCPKGKHCNFLHVFRNPGNEFWEADRDLNISPDQRGNHRDGWYSERYRDRSWRQHFYNRSPPRSERSYRKGRSRERRNSSKRSSRSRYDSSSRRSRSRSWSRSRSRSKDRERRRYRREDRARRSRSRERDGDRRHRDSRREERDVSTSPGRDRRDESSKRGSVSPHKNRKDSDDCNGACRRRKHSKKSKKRRKKKLKKKSHLTEDTSSSGESEGERHSEEDAVESLSGTSPPQQVDEELHPAGETGETSRTEQEEKPL